MFLTDTHALKKGDTGKFWKYCLSSLLWLWRWYYRCLLMSKCIKLYPLNICGSLYINYTSIKLLNLKSSLGNRLAIEGMRLIPKGRKENKMTNKEQQNFENRKNSLRNLFHIYQSTFFCCSIRIPH